VGVGVADVEDVGVDKGVVLKRSLTSLTSM
jgi:hypothetical protein